MTLLPDEDHVSRFVPGSKHDNGEILGAAFQLRLPDEEHLSVNWLEYLDQNSRSVQIDRLREIFHNKLNRVGAKAIFSVFDVGGMCSFVQANSTPETRLSIKHTPEDDDPSHSEICNIPLDDDFMISELIAEYVNEQQNVYSAVS